MVIPTHEIVPRVKRKIGKRRGTAILFRRKFTEHLSSPLSSLVAVKIGWSTGFWTPKIEQHKTRKKRPPFFHQRNTTHHTTEHRPAGRVTSDEIEDDDEQKRFFGAPTHRTWLAGKLNPQH